MEVLKAAVKLGLSAQRVVALSATQKSYSYGQLVSSAWKLSEKLQSLSLQRSTAILDGYIPRDVVALGSPVSTGLKLGLQADADSFPDDDVKDFMVSAEAVKQIRALKNVEGARVGIMAKPCAEFVAGMFATWLSGAVAVPLAVSYPEAELLHVLTDADVSIVLATEEFKGIVETVSQKCSARFYLLPPTPSFDFDEDYNVNFHDVLSEVTHLSTNEGDKAGLIIYTSGTTGKPKGVVHTHDGMAAQVRTLSEAWEYSSADRFLHCLPLHHVHGLFNALLAPLYAGAAVDFMPKFSVSGIWQRWRDSYSNDGSEAADAITVFTGVPTMYVRLLQNYGAMDLESQKASAAAARRLRLMMCGSSALPLPVMNQWETITGHRLLDRYGMTEFVMAISNPLHGERKCGTVGKELPGVEVKIISDSGREVSVGEPGELCMKSPSMFKEYWRKPQVTKDSFRDDGFFKTGDAATKYEDGYIVILGRTSVDILKSGGYKLSALEIEAVLLEHPAIAECAILGLPDRDYGEIVCAVVVLDDPDEKKARKLESVLTLEELKSWAQERMAPYKVPHQLRIWESLPRNAMGKVNKKELKHLLLAASASS
ncbi:hypothetical protein O6H91_05G123100 [Diphasiastrum complanatum]|nr:hypothetical protein O6H91_05G123100 [Diphasiastrum complanatum]